MTTAAARATARPLAAAVLAALFLLTGVVTGPGRAAAGPAAGPAAESVPVPAGSGPLTLTVTGLTPRVVTDSGPVTVSVLGTLRNTGDRPVDDLAIRLQRGEALGTEGEVRDALAGTARADAVTPAFTELPGVLEPGAERPVQLTVPLRGAPTDGLALTRPGVYELLVNVNGLPRDGVRARLAAARMLLPVLSLPAGDDPVAEPPVPAPDGPATDLTVLYPLVDTPRRLPTVPGEQTLLTDDGLAVDLGPRGRLGGLVTAYAERATRGSPVRAATCLAVDPDLVSTAAAMRQGYAVRGPDGTVPGTGAEVAGAWLDALAAVARGGCVLALPWADADLVALTRADLGDLGRLAVADGRAAVADILDTPVLDAATWPAGGRLDEAALADVAATGSRAVVLGTAAVAGSGDGADAQRTASVVPLTGGTPVLGVLTDPLLDRASAAPAPTRAAAGTAVTTAAAASPPMATQDTLSALAFRARSGPAGEGPLVLAPPHAWTADADGAGALLDAVDGLIGSGLLRPRGLADVVAAGPTAPGAARRPADPLGTGARDVPPEVLDSVRELRAEVLDLRSAAVAETGVGADLDAMFEPLLQAAVRPTSAAWHDRPELAVAAAAAASSRVDELRDSVRVLEPPSPYSLGTRDAPLLVTVANGLPVTVEVRLSISSTTGLRVAPIPTQRIPPFGRRQVQVSAEVVRSGQFAVEATVRTPAGRPLGPPSRLQVRSTAYGTITVWLTGCAAVLLVVLAARRVVRRVRGEPERDTRTSPAAGPTPPPEPPGPEPPAPDPDPPPGEDPGAPTRPVDVHPGPEPPTRPVPARRP